MSVLGFHRVDTSQAAILCSQDRTRQDEDGEEMTFFVRKVVPIGVCRLEGLVKGISAPEDGQDRTPTKIGNEIHPGEEVGIVEQVKYGGWSDGLDFHNNEA